ncbi:ninja-family protein AFP3-like [Solanum tuberosum]|uniref:ninja-family protein AFP3-like n=1 Tax=Solanum tuberosum TaxID=4113 RepID=UPI00073A19D2|nr:PREDICTED: ninja-family protein AFP3-like [Solanum tuberosum]
MEKAEENTGTSNVENENVELNGGSQGSVASSVAEVETQQPPTQGNYIAKGKIKIFMLNHMTFVFTRGEGPNGKKIEELLYSCKKKDEVEKVGLCHGDLLNVVEFVEHTGGGYVEHPLNHIFIDGK